MRDDSSTKRQQREKLTQEELEMEAEPKQCSMEGSCDVDDGDEEDEWNERMEEDESEGDSEK